MLNKKLVEEIRAGIKEEIEAGLVEAIKSFLQTKIGVPFIFHMPP